MTTYTMTNEVHCLSYKRQVTDHTKVKGHVHSLKHMILPNGLCNITLSK